MSTIHTIAAQGVRVGLDLRGGHIREFVVDLDGQRIAPLHSAPWIDDPAIVEDDTIPPSLRFLSGDFFCAPFGGSDVEPAHPHGWTANSPWTHVETLTPPGAVSARYRLEHEVLGAVVEKTFTLRDNHPFLYQTHSFIGGRGALPVANHAMVRFPQGGRLAFSAKDHAETPTVAPEPDPGRGRSRLKYPTRSNDLHRIEMAGGGVADITRYPIAERHEDIVLLVEAKGNRLGWGAALKPDGTLFVTMKNPVDYPVTVLWFSNGGRDYVPWNGRHTGVLGIEEGRTTLYGHQASIEPNALSDAGIPTALELQPAGRVEVRNVIGGLRAANGAAQVTGIFPGDGSLAIQFEDGGAIEVPYDSAFLERR